LSDLPRSTG